MSAFTIRLPDSLHDQVRELAERDNISMNQFIAIAVAEKVSALIDEPFGILDGSPFCTLFS